MRTLYWLIGGCGLWAGSRDWVLLFSISSPLLRLWQSAHYSEGDPLLRDTLVQLLTTPPEGYEPLLSSTASALGKWLDQQPEVGVALKNELIAIYKDKVKVGVVLRELTLIH